MYESRGVVTTRTARSEGEAEWKVPRKVLEKTLFF